MRKCLKCNKLFTKEEAKEHAKTENHIVFEILGENELRKYEIEKLKKIIEGGGNGIDGYNRRTWKRKNTKPDLPPVEKLVLQEEDNIR